MIYAVEVEEMWGKFHVFNENYAEFAVEVGIG